MKIRTFGYYVNQGTKNISRNKMMSIASISTVMASLLILGIFYITMTNVNQIAKDVESGIELTVFLNNDITDEEKSLIETEVEQMEGVADIEYESKQQAFENFKNQLGDNSDVVEGIDPEEVMPMSYIIRMDDPRYVDGVVDKLKSMEGIDEIKDGRQFVDKLIKVTDFIKTLGLSLMAMLLVVSVFLISNTIKLTVMARRREINIMKYIGATNWFIRWPFVIEGVVLGIVGSIISAVIVGYGYTLAADSASRSLGIVTLVDPIEILPYMGIGFVVIGVVLGFLGSALSMRKFLNV